MKGRRPIHYGIFLAVGILISGMAGFSLIVSNGANYAAMQLFFGIGLLFLLIGIIKFIIKKITQVSNNEKKFRKQMSSIDKIDHDEQKMIHESNQQSPQNIQNNIITCSRCKARNYSSSNYCHMCGLKLK